jgi:hypothetical protein
VFLARLILHDWYPWWFRVFSPPRGFFLQGNQSSTSTLEWLRTEIASSSSENPVASLTDLVKNRNEEQRFRGAMFSIFGDILPKILRPQPSLVIIDQAEELICAHRADFLLTVSPLVKLCRDRPSTLQLIFVVNSDAAVQSLDALNGGTLFTLVQCPKPSYDDVVVSFGADEQFVDIFRKLDSCIGLVYDYFRDHKDSESPEQYLLRKRRSYLDIIQVVKEVSREELAKEAHHRG